jgi:hypothetical protein
VSNLFPVTGARSFGLRARLMALVLAAVAPFVFLILVVVAMQVRKVLDVA